MVVVELIAYNFFYENGYNPVALLLCSLLNGERITVVIDKFSDMPPEDFNRYRRKVGDIFVLTGELNIFDDELKKIFSNYLIESTEQIFFAKTWKENTEIKDIFIF